MGKKMDVSRTRGSWYFLASSDWRLTTSTISVIPNPPPLLGQTTLYSKNLQIKHKVNFACWNAFLCNEVHCLFSLRSDFWSWITYVCLAVCLIIGLQILWAATYTLTIYSSCYFTLEWTWSWTWWGTCSHRPRGWSWRWWAPPASRCTCRHWTRGGSGSGTGPGCPWDHTTRPTSACRGTGRCRDLRIRENEIGNSALECIRMGSLLCERYLLSVMWYLWVLEVTIGKPGHQTRWGNTTEF